MMLMDLEKIGVEFNKILSTNIQLNYIYKAMKNKIYKTFVLIHLGITTVAQVGIGIDTPHDAAILEIQSTDKGILLPRLSSQAIENMNSVAGLMVYCTDCDSDKGVLKINNGSEWVDYIPASGGTIVNEDINPDAKIDGTKITSYFGTQDIISHNENNISFIDGGNLNSKLNNIFRQRSSADIVMASGYKHTTTPNQFASSHLDNWGRSAIGVGHGRIVFYVDTPTSIAAGTDITATERMRINATGLVGVGTNNPQYKLHVEGGVNATNHYSSSDERWKKEIKTLDNSLNKIAELRGVSYDWKRDEFAKKNFSEGTQIGVIAQEIENVFPELVHTDTEGYKSVSYSNLVAPLIEAVKELKQQNESQQALTETLQKQAKSQQVLIETLQKEIEEIKKQ